MPAAARRGAAWGRSPRAPTLSYFPLQAPGRFFALRTLSLPCCCVLVGTTEPGGARQAGSVRAAPPCPGKHGDQWLTDGRTCKEKPCDASRICSWMLEGKRDQWRTMETWKVVFFHSFFNSLLWARGFFCL